MVLHFITYWGKIKTSLLVLISIFFGLSESLIYCTGGFFVQKLRERK